MNIRNKYILLSLFTLVLTFGMSFLIIWKLKPDWSMNDDMKIDYLKIILYSLLIGIIFASVILIISVQNQFKLRRKKYIDLYKD